MPRKKTADATDALPPEPTQEARTQASPQEPPPTETTTSHSEAPTEESPQNGEKKRPVFKIGPIPCDKNTSVECAVWANEITLSDQRTFTVYNVTLHGSWRDSDGTWKPLKSFRGSHLHVLIYCLQRASDWILAQRDPQNECPF